MANRNATYFGKDADSFMPWRFLEKDSAPQLWYLTFGHDGLGCLGKKITIALLDIVLDAVVNARKLRVQSFIDNNRVTNGFHPLKRAFNLRIGGSITYQLQKYE